MSAFDHNPYASLDEDNLYTDEEDSLYSYDAEAEWEESKQQLNALFSLVIFPYIGKYLGKKFSFWIWSRYLGSRTPFISRYATLSTDFVNSVKRIT